MANSLATTVATPSKWPGREDPSQPSLTPATLTEVATTAGNPGYISSTDGANTTAAPLSPATATSASKVRG